MAIALRMPKAVSKPKKRLITVAVLTSVGLLLGAVKLSLIDAAPATAQIFANSDAWRQVYQRLPDFPKENQYVNKETGKVDENNTLASRLIRYHIFVKNRPPAYRLDWKLTLADYLGVHQYLVESQYPGSNTLRQNPMESDRAVISKLTRKQRAALVDVLASIFNTNPPEAAPVNKPVAPPPAPQPPQPPTSGSSKPTLPQPGDAQLLR